MRKIYASLLMLALMTVSTVAKAQYTVEVTSDPEDNYFSGYQAFSPAEIASALGLADEAALEQLISNPDGGGNVYIKLEDGTKSNTYTGNANEFWMGDNGYPQGYSDAGTCWYVGLSYDAGGTDEETGETHESEVDVVIGQMPGYFKKIYTDSELKCTLYLVNGETEISFDVTLKVNAAVKANIPDPTTSLKGLTIVKDYTLELPFTTGKSYEGKTYSATLEGLYEALGTTPEDFDANVSDYVYAQAVKGDSIYTSDGVATGDLVYSLLDELVRPEDAAGGAWFGRYINYDEATDKEEALAVNAPMVWNSGTNTFYTQEITLAEGEFSIVSGQFPGTFKDGDSDYTYLYLIVGDKAARVKVQAVATAPEVVDPSELVKVGETTVQVTQAVDDNYAVKPFSIDMAAALEALGVEYEDIDDQIYAWAAEGELSDNHTESNMAGYYFNPDGYIGEWGASATFFIGVTSLPNGEFCVGQRAGRYTDITEPVVLNTQFMLKSGSKYYAINLEYTVVPKEARPDDIEWHEVSAEEIEIQIIPSPDTYEWGTKTDLDLEYIASKIGTDDPVVFGEELDDEGNLSWSENYTNDPKPGFWFNSEPVNGRVQISGWDSSCSFGATYTAGVITWWQFPGTREVGENYVANIYLANEKTGAYIRYSLIVTYVDEVVETKAVLDVEDEVAVTDESFDKNGLIEYPIDTEKLAEALGITTAELGGVTLKVAKSRTVYAAADYEDDIFFSADGYAVTGDDYAVSANFVAEDGITLYIDPQELAFEEADESKATIRFAFELEGKRVTYAITFLSKNSPLAIASVGSSKAAAAGIYSVSGARLAAPQKGVNIIRYANGEVKKVLVK